MPWPWQYDITPLGGSDRCSQEFEVGGPVPRAPLEVTQSVRVGGEARGEDLGLVQVDCAPNAAEAFGVSDEEAANGWNKTSTKTVIEEKGAEIDALRVRGLRGCAGLRNGRVDSEGEKDRAEGIPLLHFFGTGDDLRGHAAEPVKRVLSRGRKVDADGPQDG